MIRSRRMIFLLGFVYIISFAGFAENKIPGTGISPKEVSGHDHAGSKFPSVRAASEDSELPPCCRKEKETAAAAASKPISTPAVIGYEKP